MAVKKKIRTCYFRGLDANRENRENKAAAKESQSTVVDFDVTEEKTF